MVYAASSTKLVATVTMDKNFQGAFKLYKESDKKYKTLIDQMGTSAGTPAGDPATVASAGAGDSKLVASAPSNYNTVKKTTGSGLGYIAPDGTVTYKWTVDGVGGTGGLTRGENYVLVFDQTSKVNDNIGSGTENKFDEAVTVPYVTKPEAIAITKAAKNAPAEITFYTDAEATEVATFMGMQTALNGAAAVGAKATSAIYSATKTGVATKDATKQGAAMGNTSSLKAGVWTSATTVGGTDAFWFASLDFKKGIYGKDEFTLRSKDQQVAYDAATAATISYKTSAPKDVKVSFGNLRTNSTVYLVALNDADGATLGETTPTVSDELPSAAFRRAYEDLENESITSAAVEAGTGEYTFEGVINGITTGSAGTGKKAGNSYIAIVIPDDEANYSPCYTGSTITTGGPGTWKAGATAVTDGVADVKATLTTYKVAGKGKITGKTASYADVAAFAAATDTGLLGVDQFGNEMKTNGTFADAATNAVLTSTTPTLTTGCKAPRRLTLAESTYAGNDFYGIITMGAADDTDTTYGGNEVDPVKNEAWTVKLTTGQTLTFTCSDPKTNATDCEWTVSIS